MTDILSKITLADTILGGGFVALLGSGVRWLWKQFKRIDELEASLKVYGNAIDSLVSTLQQKSHLTAIEASLLASTLKLTIKAEGNPITAEEAKRLNQYVQWTKDKKSFTPQQAKEFHDLATKYRNDPKVLETAPAEELGKLLVLAGIILALYALVSSD